MGGNALGRGFEYVCSSLFPTSMPLFYHAGRKASGKVSTQGKVFQYEMIIVRSLAMPPTQPTSSARICSAAKSMLKSLVYVRLDPCFKLVFFCTAAASHTKCLLEIRPDGLWSTIYQGNIMHMPKQSE